MFEVVLISAGIYRFIARYLTRRGVKSSPNFPHHYYVIGRRGDLHGRPVAGMKIKRGGCEIRPDEVTFSWCDI